MVFVKVYPSSKGNKAPSMVQLVVASPLSIHICETDPFRMQGVEGDQSLDDQLYFFQAGSLCADVLFIITYQKRVLLSLLFKIATF